MSNKQNIPKSFYQKFFKLSGIKESYDSLPTSEELDEQDEFPDISVSDLEQMDQEEGVETGSLETEDSIKDEEQSVDSKQNDAIEKTLNSISLLNQNLEQLTDRLNSIEGSIAKLSMDVDQVKMPSPEEMFEKKKEVSGPYSTSSSDYFFNQKDEEEVGLKPTNKPGIYKSKDGYVGIYNQMPKLSDSELSDSFFTY